MAISETWLKKSENIDTLCPDGYSTYRVDREDGRQGGGVLLLVAQHITQREEENFQTPNIQVAAARASVGSRNVTLTCVYRSPGATQEESTQLLLYLKALVARADGVLVMGDFNAPEVNWEVGWAPLSTFGHSIVELLLEKRLARHVNQETRWRVGQTPGLLDLIISRYQSDIDGLTVDAPLGKSDHAMLRFKFRGKVEKVPDKWRRRFNNLNEAGLVSRARQLTWNEQGASVEEMWETFKRNVLKLTEEFAPLTRINRKGLPPWWKSRAAKAQKRKHRAWKRYISTGGHQRFAEYLKEKGMATSIQRDCRLNYETKLSGIVKKCPKAYFNYVQSKGKLRNAVGAVKDENGALAVTNRQKADVLKGFFEKVHTVDTGRDPGYLPIKTTSQMELVPISQEEVEGALAKLDPSKAQGHDEIHPAILKSLAPVIGAPLATLFNKSLAERTLPEDWKRAIIVPIHKGGTKEEVTNYRPVSLLPVALKVMERLLRDRIVKHLTENGLLRNEQHGFTKNRSCLTNLLTCLDEVTNRVDNGEQVEICYLDFRKAFDSVNHRLLLAKLRTNNLHPSVQDWVEEYLSARSFRVRVEEALSESGNACSGVPQGSVLGPLLFLIYISDLPDGLEGACYMFADDVKIVGAPSTDQLQRDLNRVIQWTEEWEMPLNKDKCMRLLRPDCAGVDRIIDPSTLKTAETVSEMRDLGVKINGNFSPEAQCLAAASKANGALFQMARTIASRKPKVLMPYYKAFVRPHLEYAVQAWAPALVKDAKVLEDVQRRFTRWLNGMRGLSYEERLDKLGLFSLKRRRVRGDLIESFKELKGHSIPGKPLLTLDSDSVLRGHELKLKKPRANRNIRANFFTHRVVNNWNKLPSEVVTADSVTSFKLKLDKCWPAVFADIQ